MFRVVAVAAVAAVVVTIRITQLNTQAELVGPEDSLVVVVVVVAAGPEARYGLMFGAMAARAELVVPIRTPRVTAIIAAGAAQRSPCWFLGTLMRLVSYFLRVSLTAHHTRDWGGKMRLRQKFFAVYG